MKILMRLLIGLALAFGGGLAVGGWVERSAIQHGDLPCPVHGYYHLNVYPPKTVKDLTTHSADSRPDEVNLYIERADGKRTELDWVLTLQK